MIELHSRNNQDRFFSRHWLQTQLPNNEYLVMLSGVVHVDFSRGDQRTAEECRLDWYHDSLRITLHFDDILPAEKYLALHQWVPILTPSAFNVQVPPDAGCFGGGWYHYPGVAIDNFGLDKRKYDGDATLTADIGIRYPGSCLIRIAYQLTMIGELCHAPN